MLLLLKVKQIVSVLLLGLVLNVSLAFGYSEPADAFPHIDTELPKELISLLSNKKLLAKAESFLNTTPQSVCRAYRDKQNGGNGAAWQALQEGAFSVFTVGTAVSSASAAGAGSLAGYAGVASAVSQLGLGSLTTTIAGMLGSSATGAAATAVVTSTVGGPLVMGALLAGGTGAAAYGTYKLGEFGLEKLGDWAEQYCEFYQ